MSHIRNEDDDGIEDSLDELIYMSKYCPVHVSHIKVVYGKGEKRANEILRILDSARNRGNVVTALCMDLVSASFQSMKIVVSMYLFELR